MKVLLRKKYLDEYDLKQIVKAVHNLFDDYNYKQSIAQEYLEGLLCHQLIDRPEHLTKHRKSDPTQKSVEKREKVVKYLNEFDTKLSFLLDNKLTPEEIKIYKYCILEREQDKVVRDRICKTDKTFYPIKKSCYVKIALRFGLVDGFTKNVFATISLLD